MAVSPETLARLVALLELPVLFTQRDIADERPPIPQVAGTSLVGGQTIKGRPLRFAGVKTLNEILRLLVGSIVQLDQGSTASQINNDSAVGGANVADALDILIALIFSGLGTVVKPPFIENFDIGGLDAVMSAGGNITDQRVYYFPIVVPRALTISALQARVTNVTSVGPTLWDVSMAVYNYDDSSRSPGTRVFFGSVTGINGATDVDVTSFTGTPALVAGRYFLALLATRTAGGGAIRAIIPNDLDTTVMGFVGNQIQVEDGQSSFPGTASASGLTSGDQAHWMRALVSLP